MRNDPQFAIFAVGGIEPAFFEQAAEEFLREVLGVMGRLAAAADIGVKRIPIGAADGFQRRRRFRRGLLRWPPAPPTSACWERRAGHHWMKPGCSCGHRMQDKLPETRPLLQTLVKDPNFAAVKNDSPAPSCHCQLLTGTQRPQATGSRARVRQTIQRVGWTYHKSVLPLLG